VSSKLVCCGKRRRSGRERKGVKLIEHGAEQKKNNGPTSTQESARAWERGNQKYGLYNSQDISSEKACFGGGNHIRKQKTWGDAGGGGHSLISEICFKEGEKKQGAISIKPILRYIGLGEGACDSKRVIIG